MLAHQYRCGVEWYDPSLLASARADLAQARALAEKVRDLADVLAQPETADDWAGWENWGKWKAFRGTRGPPPSPFERLRDDIQTLAREAAIQAVIRDMVFRKRRNGRKGALDRFIGCHMVPCYERIFDGRKAAVSRPSGGGAPDGPFVRFMDQFFREIGRPAKRETLASRLRRAQRAAPTIASREQRVRRAAHGAKRAKITPAAPF
jgi:hypothetical protein